jgi:lactoylglutathione lyase
MKYQGFIWAGFMVEDLESSIAFYRDVLGLPLLGKGNDWAHFDAGNGAMLELLTEGTGSREPKRPDQQPIIPGLRVDDLDNAIKGLKQKGVRFIGEVGEYAGTRWAQFTDPEGNRLEIKEIP